MTIKTVRNKIHSETPQLVHPEYCGNSQQSTCLGDVMDGQSVIGIIFCYAALFSKPEQVLFFPVIGVTQGSIVGNDYPWAHDIVSHQLYF